MRLLLDEMYSGRLAERLRSSGHDVVGVVERGDLVSRPDIDIARWARNQQRVVVTENVVDFVTLDAADHAGLLLLNARRWPRKARGLGRIGTALDEWLAQPRDETTVNVHWL